MEEEGDEKGGVPTQRSGRFDHFLPNLTTFARFDQFLPILAHLEGQIGQKKVVVRLEATQRLGWLIRVSGSDPSHGLGFESRTRIHITDSDPSR